MIVFKRPDAAFHAYEQRLARQPANWPPTNHSVPTLWERAKALLQATVETVGSAFRLAYRQTFTRPERRELLIRLVPVEKIVRTLLIVEALTFLLMTPQGARLRRDTAPVAPPEPQPTKKLSPFAERYRLALQTIAAHRPRIDPRVEAQKQRAQAARDSQYSLTNPAPWRCHFHVIGWTTQRPLATEWTRPATGHGCLVHNLDPAAHIPLEHLSAPTAQALTDDDTWDDPTGPALALARRIEALSRILANPQPAIRRLAARLATFTRETFPCPAPQRYRATYWWHGRPEYYNAMTLVAPAHRAAFGAPVAPSPRLLDPG